MTSKIRVRMGDLEVEYEGEPAFLKDGLLKLIQSVSEIRGTAPPDPAGVEAGETKPHTPGKITGSVNTLASRMGVKKGPELVLAALAHEELVLGKSTTTRKHLIAQMKGATTYCRGSYIGNLTSALNGLLRTRAINEPSAGTYALSEKTKKALEAKLAG